MSSYTNHGYSVDIVIRTIGTKWKGDCPDPMGKDAELEIREELKKNNLSPLEATKVLVTYLRD